MLNESMFRKTLEPSIEEGKDDGLIRMADVDHFMNFCVAEYVWIDANGNTRSKTKTVTKRPREPDDCGIWVFDGASTGQAKDSSADVYLVPRKIFDAPIRGPPHVMIVCEAVTASMEPAAGSYRAEAAEIMGRCIRHDPWFGFEQEYTLMYKGVHGVPTDKMLGLDDDGKAAPQGPYYCGAGGHVSVPGLRGLMDDHYACCIAAGIQISGCNLEDAVGQAEFQIGPCRGMSIGDHVIAARHLLRVLAERRDCVISYDAKPKEGRDWSGNGGHMNFSAKSMRGPGGLKAIQAVVSHMEKCHDRDLPYYGENNAARLIGDCNASDGSKFTSGVANRTCSVRVPQNVAVSGKGHLEDRRPAGNCDPYRVAGVIMRTAREALDNGKF
jgi:glutamine synthetase